MPLFVHPSRAKPPPEPLQTDDRRAVVVGMGIWALLLVVTLVVPELRGIGRGRWLGTCIAGVLLGFVALAYLRVRDRRS